MNDLELYRFLQTVLTEQRFRSEQSVKDFSLYGCQKMVDEYLAQMQRIDDAQAALIEKIVALG